jgi:two-component system, NtrC family, response regulator
MILIVDDDPSVTTSLALLLKQSGYKSQSVSSPAEALERLEQEQFDLVLQDMNFSRQTTGEEGLDLLGKIKKGHHGLPVILITAWGSIELAVRGMRHGASDFITKPWTHQQILQSVGTALGLAEVRTSLAVRKTETREELDQRYDYSRLVGQDPEFVRILSLVGRVAATDASVLIMGESGTGKELVADAIHRNSQRRKSPFIKVNLGGIPSSLFESEMFGHVKGAFTDARQDRRGRFEMANGGTIFLDEIGDLDSSAQVKLLRVLQDRTYEVLGSSLTRTVDVRVISATNQSLPDMIGRGQFREDLLYRLNLIALFLPPLRQRPHDIPVLAKKFLESIARVYRRKEPSIDDRAVRWLQKQAWPGNIRQLKQVIERAMLMTERDVLGTEDLEMTQWMDNRREGDVLPEVGQMTMDEMEKGMIVKAMNYHRGNVSKVAESLGLSRATLYRRFEKYDIKT